MAVVSSQLGEIEMPKVEMGNNTGTSKESWEGLGVEDKGMDKGEGKKAGDKLVSAIFS